MDEKKTNPKVGAHVQNPPARRILNAVPGCSRPRGPSDGTSLSRLPGLAVNGCARAFGAANRCGRCAAGRRLREAKSAPYQPDKVIKAGCVQCG